VKDDYLRVVRRLFRLPEKNAHTVEHYSSVARRPSTLDGNAPTSTH
jgi:hypothetical protein